MATENAIYEQAGKINERLVYNVCPVCLRIPPPSQYIPEEQEEEEQGEERFA